MSSAQIVSAAAGHQGSPVKDDDVLKQVLDLIDLVGGDDDGGPLAQVQGIDYWPAMWNYGKEQCEGNAAAEGVADRCAFRHGDAAQLDFPDNHFDAVVSNFVFHEVRTQKDKFMLVEESLRVLKKGGAFALHDTFENRDLYGKMDEFITYLKEKGISDISYLPHSERRIDMPLPVRFMLRGMGILYGTK